MKRITSIFLIVTVIMSVLIVGSVSTSAASEPDIIVVTRKNMDKTGSIDVQWRTRCYCKYYRVYYKINNSDWVRAAEVYYKEQGDYYIGQIMKKRISAPLNKIQSGSENTPVKIYVTVRGLNYEKQFTTSFSPYLSYSGNLGTLAPRLYLSRVENKRATFTIFDPPNISNSTKFRVYYWDGKTWKAIGDYSKGKSGSKGAMLTINVPQYKYKGIARFTVRGINNKGQHTTPFLNNAVVGNYPDYRTFQKYKSIAG